MSEDPLYELMHRSQSYALLAHVLLHAQALGVEASEEIYFGEPSTFEPGKASDHQRHLGPEAAQLPNGDAHANHVPISNGNIPSKVSRGCW